MHTERTARGLGVSFALGMASLRRGPVLIFRKEKGSPKREGLA